MEQRGNIYTICTEYLIMNFLYLPQPSLHLAHLRGYTREMLGIIISAKRWNDEY